MTWSPLVDLSLRRIESRLYPFASMPALYPLQRRHAHLFCTLYSLEAVGAVASKGGMGMRPFTGVQPAIAGTSGLRSS